ncbi:MAG: ISAs1 family transposase [Actinomycetota bacterium]|nr:ISAs1 family transposase [Actinomycetota bacterium]
MPALSSSPIPPVLAHLAAAADIDGLTGTGLVAAFAQVPDPRARRGVWHQISAILVLAVCAVLAGCRLLTAIGQWVANASDQVLAALKVGAVPPCESTIWRTLQRLDGDGLETVIGGWAAECTQPPAGRRRVVALDGKTVRGLASDTADARHLLAAIDHRTAVVLGQVNVASKTNEIPMFPVLCDRIDDLEETVITADALHAQRGHADYLVLQRRAHYLLTVKGNQSSLLNQLKALPWKDVPPAHTSSARTHGRVEQRLVKLVTVATGIVFPHARQAIQIIRKTRRLDSNKWTTEVVYAVTSLTTEQATAAELAAWVRGHWAIENRLHRVRDVTYDEDRSQVRTGTGPHAMASLRNLALSVLRINGATNITQALRHHAWDPLRPAKLLLSS